MAAGPGKNDGSNSNSEWTWAVSLVLLLGFLVGGWYLYRAPIVYAVYGLKWVEIKAYSLIFGLKEGGLFYLDRIERVFSGRMLAEDVWFSEMWATLGAVGAAVRIPMAVIILLLGGLIILRMKGNGYKNTYKLDGFIRYQALHWKTLTPSAHFNPDTASSSMASSMRPADWMKKHGVDIVTDNAGKIFGDARDKVAALLRQQVGESWKTMKKLPLPARCIVAICVTHAERKKDDFKRNIGLTLREEISQLYTFEKDLKVRDEKIAALVDPILADKKRVEKVEEFAKAHAYIGTVLIRLLAWSREEAGVLATAEFLWLKEQNRVLYYTLNTVGRQRRSFIECAGMWSHYYHERVLQRAIYEPQVDQAILGLESYISEQGIGEIAGMQQAA